MGYTALQAAGVDINVLRHKLHPLPIDEYVPAPKLPLDGKSQRVLEQAWAESKTLGDDYVGTEHLCIAISRSNDEPAILMHSMGATADELQVHTLLFQAPYLEYIGEFERSRDKYKLALALAPNHPSANGDYAWMLSTCRHPSFRDGQRAVFLANEACQLTNFKRASCLDTLAAAYAEVGDFENAVNFATRAIAIASPERLDECAKRLELYRQKLPYRWVSNETPDQSTEIV